MGFLHDLGHVQVNRAMPAFDDLLNQINLTCYTSVFDANPHNYHPDNSKFILDNPIVIGLSLQIYNEVMHWVSHHAGAHDIQKGYITTALAGAWAASGQGKSRKNELVLPYFAASPAFQTQY